jgi:hypothetical protein
VDERQEGEREEVGSGSWYQTSVPGRGRDEVIPTTKAYATATEEKKKSEPNDASYE